MKVEYASVSTKDGSTNGCVTSSCEKVFQDKVSGVQDKRNGLDEAHQYVRTGDTLVVWGLD